MTPVYSVNGTVYRTGEFGWNGSCGSVVPSSSANGYRLPTEAEWEWAARGGVISRGYTYSGSNDVNAVAWFQDNSDGAPVNLRSGRGTFPVGSKDANELGIHDMSGNVYEWCWDGLVRGGSWGVDADGCAITDRGRWIPDGGENTLGFRLARNAP